MLAKLDTNALKLAEKSLYKFGGKGVWTDITTDAIKDDFGNIITPAVVTHFNISILPTKVKDGWLNSGIANADNKVFQVSAKQLNDYGVAYDGKETITFDGTTYSIERDEPDMGGSGAVLHNFICTVTN